MKVTKQSDEVEINENLNFFKGALCNKFLAVDRFQCEWIVTCREK